GEWVIGNLLLELEVNTEIRNLNQLTN
ncbi:MAG: hypothetical protein RLZZ148_1150, partial [Cyanobacteriota bacterium]